MNDLLNLWETPLGREKIMVAGWHQWADAGSISSGLPQYLIHRTAARRIGAIKPDGCYLFQVPGTHHFLRPEVKFEAGYRKELTSTRNEFFYADLDSRGLLIFLGEEPHLNVEHYAHAFLDAVEELEVKRVLGLGGVYGSMPYDKDREISCVYSLPRLKDELARYALKFSDYEGGATIGAYLVDQAEARGIEFVDMYAFVPSYDFAQLSDDLQGMRIETDFKAWYDVMRRINHMFDLGLDLSELARQSSEIIASMEAEIEALESRLPQLKVREYIQELARDFTELPFAPLDEVWERELGDLFDDSN